MSNVICKKCGSEASSKCPFCRSVFLTNQKLAIVSNIFETQQGVEEYGKPLGKDAFLIEVAYCFASDKEATEAELFEQVMNMVHSFREWTDEEIKQIFCRHHWEFKEGCESSIGCGHGGKKK